MIPRRQDGRKSCTFCKRYQSRQCCKHSPHDYCRSQGFAKVVIILFWNSAYRDIPVSIKYQISLDRTHYTALIQLIKCSKFVKTPGKLGRAQPWPQETIPTSFPSQASGPPLSPVKQLNPWEIERVVLRTLYESTLTRVLSARCVACANHSSCYGRLTVIVSTSSQTDNRNENCLQKCRKFSTFRRSSPAGNNAKRTRLGRQCNWNNSNFCSHYKGLKKFEDRNIIIDSPGVILGMMNNISDVYSLATTFPSWWSGSYWKWKWWLSNGAMCCC